MKVPELIGLTQAVDAIYSAREITDSANSSRLVEPVYLRVVPIPPHALQSYLIDGATDGLNPEKGEEYVAHEWLPHKMIKLLWFTSNCPPEETLESQVEKGIMLQTRTPFNEAITYTTFTPTTSGMFVESKTPETIRRVYKDSSESAAMVAERLLHAFNLRHVLRQNL